MIRLLYILIIAICYGCASNSETEKFQGKRNNVINVRDKIKEIKIDDVIIGAYPHLYQLDDYLIISDSRADDKMIHIFDKRTFDYVASTGHKGEGPKEITILGHVGVDEVKHILYISDHGKQKIFSFDLDSVLKDHLYVPRVKMRMDEKQFPDQYQFFNDTLCIGVIIKPIGTNDFKPIVSKWNFTTGAIIPMEYEHPEIEKKRICFAVSMENELYVECYYYHDLMTICCLDGKLKYNIYGENWSSKKTNRNLYYAGATFCKDKILVSYLGDTTFSKNQNGGIKSNSPTKFMVFDLNGEYLQTLETGYEITDFCYDKEGDRIIMSLNDADLQFAYMNLDGII